jgi:Mg-chelatase subunit ChlD
MKYILTLFFITLASCHNTDHLNPICGNVGNKCFAVWHENPEFYRSPGILSRDQADYYRSIFLDNKNPIGSCRLGEPTCDQDYNILDCVGEVLPEEFDQCNGKDENCNGEVDDGYYPPTSRTWNLWEDYSVEDNPCPSMFGVCKDASITCEDGKFVCNLPPDYEVVEQSCDDKDNDCDAKTDEDLFPGEACYGPNDPDELWEDWFTATHPPCHMGAKACVNGIKTCVNQALPSIEICGDFIDNNCDGIIDNSDLIEATKIDYVFIIDTSGSMCSYIYAVSEALSLFIQSDNNPNHRYSIVIMTNIGTPKVITYQNFTDVATLSNQLSALSCSGTGAEESLGSIKEVCDVTNNPLSLDWDSGSAKIAAVFTDERAQTYTPYNTTSQDAIDTCRANGVLPFIWGWNPSPVLEDIALQSGGGFFELVSNVDTLFEDINSIKLWICS